MERLFLLHALGADERMFSCLGELPVETLTPRLPTPLKKESMAAYADRVACDMGISGEDFVGGCSFGGMVASEIARQRRLKGLLLIGSGLSTKNIFPAARTMGRLSIHMPRTLVGPALDSDHVFRQVFGPDIPPLYDLARKMLRGTSGEMLLSGGRLILEYFPGKEVLCPIYAIHGGADQAMKPCSAAVRIVPGAGHGMVLTHAEKVTEFIRKVLADDPDLREG